MRPLKNRDPNFPDVKLILGEVRVSIDSSTNLDNCTKLNTTYIWGGGSVPTNAPFGYGTMIVTLSQSVHSLCQICIYRAGAAPRLVYRLMDADIFGPWFEISKTQLP